MIERPDLPSRPNSHALETLSIRAFEGHLPESWTSTRPEADYGIDRDVEVFEHEHATGLKFGAQVKGSTSSLEEALGVRIKVSTYRYLLANPYPCMLVVYHEPTESLYWRWVGRFRVEPDESAQTVTLRLSESDTWTDSTAAEILVDLASIRDWFASDPSVPLTYGVAGDWTGLNVTRAELVARLNTAPAAVFVRANQSTGGPIVVELAPTYVEARLASDVASFRWTHNGLVDVATITDSGVVVICIALVVARTGKIALAARLLVDAPWQAIQLIGPPVAWQTGVILGDSADSESLVALLESTPGVQTVEDLAVVALLLAGIRLALLERLFADPPSAEGFGDSVAVVLRRIDDDLDQAWVGREWSRTADLYFHAGNHRNAIRCLREAVDANSDLRREAQWLRKCGAVTFELRRFGWSAVFYRAAVDCAPDAEDLKGPLADALLWAGEYSDAVDAFEAYLETIDSPEPWWFLKAVGLKGIASTPVWRDRGRGEVPARLLAQVLDDDPEIGKRASKEALGLDLLCHEAWDRYGHELARAEEVDRALDAFVMAAVSDPTCLNGYVGVIQMALRTGYSELLQPLIALGSYVNGDAFTRELLSDIREQTGGVPEELAEAVAELAATGLDWRRRKYPLAPSPSAPDA